MCNCIEVNSQLIKSAILNEKGISDVEYVSINSTWSKDRKAVIIADVAFKVQLKNGKTADKNKQYSVICSYCPFCGKQYK